MFASLRRPVRAGGRSFRLLGVGVAGSALIAVATAWACTPVANSNTFVSPASQLENGVVTMSANGLPADTENYTARFKGANTTTACDHMPETGAEVSTDGSGVISSQNRIVPFFNDFREGAGQVCWSNFPEMNNQHSSNPTNFTIISND